jgi:cytochrome P450
MDVSAPIRLERSFVRDTRSVYEMLGTDAPPRPVIMPDGVPGWLVTRYTEARALLDDRRLSKDHARAAELFPDGLAAGHRTPLGAHMLNADPPDHTRLRKLVNKAFTSGAVARLRPRVEEITDELLAGTAAAMTADGEADLLETLAFPLPVAVISELLGVPHSDRERLRAWSRAFTSGAPAEATWRAYQEADTYLRSLVAAKRDEPAEDLLSDLVRVSDEGDRLSEDELVAMAFLLLVAGHETTVNLIGNGVLALLRHPDQLAALRADRSLLPGAVEEFLRYDGPLHMATVRFTTEAVPVGDVLIPPGEFVMISLLAANRDGTRFDDPERFDVTRQPGGHVAFGHGIHYCVGAPLARLEGEIAFGRLLDRFATLELARDAGELTWRGSILMHGLRDLPVRVG